MEGFESISGADWRKLKEKTLERADDLISNISGFENMDDAEKIVSLRLLLDHLTEDNANRFVAEDVAIRLSRLIERDRYSRRLLYLQN